MPKTCVKVWDLFTEGKIQEAIEIQKTLSKCDSVLTKAAIAGTKSAIQSYYGYGGYPRSPLKRLDEVKTKGIAHGIAEVGPSMRVTGLDRQAAAMLHRIARIERQIGQRLADLGRIGQGPPQVRCQCRHDADRLPQRPACQHRHMARQQRIQIDDLRYQRLLAGKRQQPSVRPRTRSARYQDVARQLGLQGLVPHHVQQQVDIADDHAKQVVEVVRDAAGQLAHRFSLLRLPKHLLGALAHLDLLRQRKIGGLQVRRPLDHATLQRQIQGA